MNRGAEIRLVQTEVPSPTELVVTHSSHGPQLLSSSAGSSLLPKRKRKRIRRPGPLETETCSLDGAKPEKRAKVSELVSTSPSEVREPEDPQEHQFVFDTLQVYLKDRHGFHIGIGETWNPSTHEENQLTLGRKDHAVAAKIFLQHNANLSEQEFDSVIDSFNTTVNSTITYSALPNRWELGSYLLGAPYLDMSKVMMNRVEVDGAITYILRPAMDSTDACPWFIVVPSATAMLEVYRKKWNTMQMIAHRFLARGIPFRTVVERDSPPPRSPTTEKLQGMGNREKGYIFTASDYAAYQHAQANVFSSPRGRVLRMLGGIIARLAFEAVPDVNILNGPSICDDVVLRYGDRYLLDDGISEEVLDIVSGVHHVALPFGNAYAKHESYWPRHSVWVSSGMWGDQWSPAAEAFYRARLQMLSIDTSTTKCSGEWKGMLRNSKTKTTAFIKGSEGLADQFIRDCTRAR